MRTALLSLALALSSCIIPLGDGVSEGEGAQSEGEGDEGEEGEGEAGEGEGEGGGNGDPCVDSGDCGAGLVCFEGVCDVCLLDDECPGDQVCGADGHCRDAGAEGEGEGEVVGEGEGEGEVVGEGEGEVVGEGEGEEGEGEGEAVGEGEGEEGEGEGEGDVGEGEGEGVGEGEGEGEEIPGLDVRPNNTTCVAPSRPVEENPGVALTRVFPNLQLTAPLFMLERPGDPEHFYAIEREGLVVRWTKSAPNQTTPELFCDISDRVVVDAGNANSEQGLLGIAFHPTSGDVFLSYTAVNDNTTCSFDDPADCRFEERLSRFDVVADGCVASSEVVVLDVDDFAVNHNGGFIAFDAGGLLWWGTGDGGGANDPQRTGQDLTTLLGKLLRIDVDGTDSDNGNYGVPADNPFTGVAGARAEIYAYGFRNPWRFSIDDESDTVWVGDVGQDNFEEIDVVSMNAGGGNYGWSAKEASDCRDDVACAGGGFVDPVVEYAHSNQLARFSVTGGYRYRGPVAALAGTYVFGDFASKEVFAHTPGSSTFTVVARSSGSGIASFAEDSDRNVYVVDLAGAVFRIDAAATVDDDFPQRLSDTGCVSSTDPRNFSSSVISYGVNHGFFSDGAAKVRGVGLPNGATVSIGSDGDMDLPVGTALVKTFTVAGAQVETRFFVRHDDGEWAGYTYEWSGNDATLVADAGKTKTLPNGQTWTFPSRAACMSCHTAAAGRTLGWEIGQLNGDFTYEQTGRTANQLFTLGAIGVFSNPVADVDAAVAYPALRDLTASAEERSRAYLHVNCAMCHQPGGGGQSAMDVRFSTSFRNANLCNQQPQEGDLGVAGARLLVPGDPSRSLVSLRMRRTGTGAMPPIGRNVVDSAGASVVDSWIDSVTRCP